jgi:hypothetical protein
MARKSAKRLAPASTPVVPSPNCDPRTPLDRVKGAFCAAVELLVMAEQHWTAPRRATLRARAVRVADEFLAALPELETLPPALAHSVAGTMSLLPELRDPSCSDRPVGYFVCSVHHTSTLATSLAAVVASDRCRALEARGRELQSAYQAAADAWREIQDEMGWSTPANA